jgi:hypothetical protein
MLEQMEPFVHILNLKTHPPSHLLLTLDVPGGGVLFIDPGKLFLSCILYDGEDIDTPDMVKFDPLIWPYSHYCLVKSLKRLGGITS